MAAGGDDHAEQYSAHEGYEQNAGGVGEQA
jgi:hypothetical protein